jgi:hypothetical protein
VFVAAGTCLPSRFLATIGGDTKTQTARLSHKPTFIFSKQENQTKKRDWYISDGMFKVPIT